MSYAIRSQEYGKSRIRLTKVDRDGDTHDVTELEISVSLEGEFDHAYTKADNSRVIPTDTMKNTVYALARQQDVRPIELFATTVARHFIGQYSHVTQATVEVEQRPWQRVTTAAGPHPHQFLGTSTERHRAQAVVCRDASSQSAREEAMSGLAGLALMKTTQSGFSDFLRDEFTTLQDTDDRIFATTVDAQWSFASPPTDPLAVRQQIREKLIATFGAAFSPSVQATLYEMAGAVLDACFQLASIEISMPNQHRLLVDLEPFGLDNPNVIFMPTDDPYGMIKARIERENQ